MEKCKICNKECYSKASLSMHIVKQHNLKAKEYYDLYIKNENEELCVCGKIKPFLDGNRGYQKHCSNQCAALDKEVREKTKKTHLEKYGVDHPKKLNDFKQKDKNTKLERYGDENYINVDKAKNTKLERYGDENYNNMVKFRKTNLEKYGEEYPLQIKEVKEKRDKNNKEKYGVASYIQTEKHRKFMEENGYWTPLNKLSEKEKYYYEVLNETRKWKKQLFSQWNGLDYYTGEKLVLNEEFKKQNPKEDIRSNKLQPTIDHKISIIYGLINEIDPKIIGNIKNLCICSRKENGKKWRKCYEF
jgi:hypothetical protein